MNTHDTQRIQQFAYKIKDKIHLDMNECGAQMAAGAAKDFSEYRYRCGFLAGLARAEEYVKELAQFALKDEDDE